MNSYWRRLALARRACSLHLLATLESARKRLHQSVVQAQRLHDGRVLLGSLLELVEREAVVLVQVHVAEDLIDTLLGRVLVLGEGDHLARHLVDRAHNLEHLVVRDEAVLVDVVELEGPCVISFAMTDWEKIGSHADHSALCEGRKENLGLARQAPNTPLALAHTHTSASRPDVLAT